MIKLDRESIIGWLKETDKEHLKDLYQTANQLRLERVGDEVHLRGLIEFSNNCVRQCAYCGLNKGHKEVSRYRMTESEIIAVAREAKSFGYGTVVLQSGEDWYYTGKAIERIVRGIKEETGLAITLSLGERKQEELEAWYEAGADRYLVRFETSNAALYDKIHPDPQGSLENRLKILKDLRKIGYEVGSGVMIGIPGQTWDDLANDLLTFKELDLDMIGCGPYIEHPDTELGRYPEYASDEEQVPNTEQMAYKVLALVRLLCPDANIPSTTAIATLNKKSGRENGLSVGANILMPNMTPIVYRSLYEIYPAKACLDETAQECQTCMSARIAAIGRKIGTGPGNSPNKKARS